MPDTAPIKTSWFAIGGGAYEERLADGAATGRYRARPYLNHRSTWRKLKAHSRAKAIKEASRADWLPKADSFAALMDRWQKAGCPGRKTAPSAKTQQLIDSSFTYLRKYFGKYRCDEIRIKHLDDYAAWRRRSITRGDGGRAIDIDIQTLSNIHHYGVKLGILDVNYLYRARPRYQKKSRAAIEVMPASAEDIHAIAAGFLTNLKSEVMAWVAFFSQFTGIRHSELLRLDLNAQENEPGHIEWFLPAELEKRTDGILGQLHLGHRNKNGINPWSEIGPEFAEMIRAFKHWQRERFGPVKPDEPRWYFPGETGGPIKEKSFNHALTRAAKELGLKHITPHGFRAFFATKHLRDGRRPVEIAYDIGDRSVALVEKIYTSNPRGRKLWWVPADALPAWHHWLPVQNGKVIDYTLTTEKPRSIEKRKNVSKSQ